LGAVQPDSGLIRRALAGDAEAFARVCEGIRARLWRIAASVARGPEAEDLAQEAIVRAWCARRSYRAEASFEAWICRIALNLAHDSRRSAWRRRVVLWRPASALKREEDEPLEGAVARREAQRRVRQAVAALPERQRVPIWLHYFEEFTLAEVARLERASESTIRSRVQAGLRRLSRSLGDLAAGEIGEAVRLEADAKGCEA
jgi:RNA polymerase sigma-70 factor (ECF subfamily)